MTPGSPDGRCRSWDAQDRGEAAPVLVLALGNLLLGDDGVGLALLEELRYRAPAWGARVELVDGGTQGMMLLGYLEGRQAVVLLDAAALGAGAGTVHLLAGEELLSAVTRPADTAHEMGAGELLRAAALLGALPRRIALVGVEPAQVTTGVCLSQPVRAALRGATVAAVAAIEAALGAVSLSAA